MFNLGFNLINALATEVLVDIIIMSGLAAGIVTLAAVGIFKFPVASSYRAKRAKKYVLKENDEKFINNKVRKTKLLFSKYNLNRTNKRQRKYRNMLYLFSQANIDVSAHKQFFESINDDCFVYNDETKTIINTKRFNYATGKCDLTEALRIANKKREKNKAKTTSVEKYKVCFDPNGGKISGAAIGETLVKEMRKGSKVYLPDSTKVKYKNHDFINWSTITKDGSIYTYDPNECYLVGKNNITFTANWKQKENIKTSQKSKKQAPKVNVEEEAQVN